MNSERLIRRFREFGGSQLLWEYARMGLLPLCFRQTVAILMGKRKPMEAYRRIMNRAEQKLRNKFSQILDEIDYKYSDKGTVGGHSDKVWVCWMQGMDAAPDIVKVCYHSLLTHLSDREVVLLTKENIGQYVEIPNFIEKKFNEGKIPIAHYTDLLRLELLIKYGGTWIDATVLCTGDDYPKEMLEADLFFFQQLRRGEMRFSGISNWFITSCTGNWVLKELRELLYRYWEQYDCVVHYYMFHLFFGMIVEKHPDVASRMPRYGNRIPHYLSRRMGDEYDVEWMEKLKEHSCFHKLSSRLEKSVLERKGTFYDVVIKQAITN